MQRATTKLRALVKAGKFLELPSAYDAITARLAERIGFKTIYSGGFVTGGSTCVSEPMLTMTEQIRVASDMANAVDIPVIMDAGAGWGEPLHTMRTVRECIRAGIAGVHIEGIYSNDELRESSHTANHSQYLRDNGNVRVLLQGNADERGSREYNLALGQRRADAVRNAMTLSGAKESQIESVSLGEEKPRATGHDESSWAENRRTDIRYQGE